MFENGGDSAVSSTNAPSLATQDVVSAFSSLIQELRGLVPSANAPLLHQHVSPNSGPGNATNSTPGSFASPESINPARHGSSRKRRRVDSCGNPNIELASQLTHVANDSTKLPPPEILEEIINAYFNVIQPWIPVVHETRFRRRLDNHEQRPELIVLLHAMVVAAARFVDSETQRISVQEVDLWTSRSRSIVRLSATEELSVENLQALIIIVFHDVSIQSPRPECMLISAQMGNGDISNAWPIIGSLTRTVEYLQLSVEIDDPKERPLLRPLSLIPPAENWTQDEERRRVFWTTFNLDR